MRAQVVDVVVAPHADAAHAIGTQAGGGQARRERQEAADVPRRRQFTDGFARERRHLTRVLDIYDGRLRCYRNGLSQLTDAHRRVDGRGKPGRQDDVVTLLTRETRQRERHGVGANRQVRESILPVVVARRRANLFDQRRARRLDDHAGYDSARCIPDRTGNLALLCKGSGWQQRHDRRNRQEYFRRSIHPTPPVPWRPVQDSNRIRQRPWSEPTNE